MKAAEEDQRAFKRYQVNMTVLVQLVPTDGEMGPERQSARRSPLSSVVVTDLSLSGLVFVSSRAYALNSVVEIQFTLGANVHSVRAIVKRSDMLSLPGRRAHCCAAQLVRGEGVSRFIPAVAKYLHHRYGASCASR